jgi:hypothetical protein
VTADITSLSGLNTTQQQVVNDAIAQLTAEGYYVDQWEIEALARAGYNAATIVALIKSLNDGHTNVYLEGRPTQSGIVDFFATLVTFLTLEATSNLRFLQAGYESRKPGQSIRSVIPNYDQLPKSVQRWLLMKPSDPLYYTEFGNAVEDLVAQRIAKVPGYQSWARQYSLKLNQPLPGNPRLIPDIQFRLPNGCIGVIDITSFAQVNTKQKYNVNGVCYIIVAIHGLP